MLRGRRPFRLRKILKMKALKSFLLFIFGSFCVFTAYSKDTAFKELRSEHFIINYALESENSVYKIRDDAEYCYRTITQEFGLTQTSLWSFENRAAIFIAKDRQDYLSQFNCPPWSAACVNYFRRIIYTYPSQENFSQMLMHELTHIIFREYIGFGRLPLWVDEGMATYISKRGSLEEQLAVTSIKQLISTNKYIQFSRLNSIYALGTGIDTAVFYEQAFSIIYFLRKRFGREDFAEFLSYLKSGSNIEEAIRRAFSGIGDMNALEEAWKRFYSL